MRKIMIIDDEKDFLVITKLNIENTGEYEVLTMSDAQNVLEAVYAFKPQVILLDILMPKMDGVEVCRILNADPEGRKIPIIILSALDTDKDKKMMYKLGVVDYLIKPIELKDLIAKINKALEFK